LLTYIDKDNLKNKSKQWLDEIADFNTHNMTLSKEHTALLVIDMQNYFLNPKSYEFTPSGIIIKPVIKSLVEGFRKKNLPVIFTKHAHHPSETDAGIMKWWWKGMCVENTPGCEVIDELKPLENERVIVKRRYSAFYNTDLDTILRCMKVEDLVITGIMTNMCCESTARDAYYRDYRVFFTADATGSITEKMHLASLMNIAFGFAYVTDSDYILENI
jgi:nicotinamidase-related amidase